MVRAQPFSASKAADAEWAFKARLMRKRAERKCSGTPSSPSYFQSAPRGLVCERCSREYPPGRHSAGEDCVEPAEEGICGGNLRYD